MSDIDSLIAHNTGFRSFDALLNSFPHYRPSLDMSQEWARTVADAYDAAMESRGDARRAYRYGTKAKAKRNQTGLQRARELITQARDEMARNVRKDAPKARFTRGRGIVLWAIDANGERLNENEYTEFKSWRDVRQLEARYPGAESIVAQGGLNYAESLADLTDCYDWDVWEVCVWTR